MESAYEELETCSVCFLRYNEEENRPKLLPCLHTICCRCVKNLPTKITPAPTRTSGATSSVASPGTVKQGEQAKSCPLCRDHFKEGTLQDNRYILVHLRQVRKAQTKTSSEWQPGPTPSFQASAPPRSTLYYDEGIFEQRTKDQMFGPTDSCQFSISSTQILQLKKESVLSSLTNLESRLLAYSLSLEDMEKILDDASQALATTRSELENLKKEADSLKVQVTSVKSVCGSSEVPSEPRLLSQFQDLIEEIRLSNEWLLNYMTKMDGRVSVENLHSGEFKLNDKGKQFVVASKMSKNIFDISLKKLVI